MMADPAAHKRNPDPGIIHLTSKGYFDEQFLYTRKLTIERKILHE